MYDTKVIEFKGMPLFVKARFKPNYVMQGTLKDYACFFYLTQGQMLSNDARGVHKIGSREAIMKNCGNYVTQYVSSEQEGDTEAIAVYLYPDLLKAVYKNEVPSFLEKDRTVQPKKFIGNRHIEEYINNLSIYFEEPETLDEELGILKIKELVMILLKSEQFLNVQELLSEIFTSVNIAFKETIEQHLFSQLSLEQLAFICNMSLSTFKREFKKQFEASPAKYIKNKRLEEAASKLLCNNDPVSSIAYDCGFNDPTTFSAIFVEKYGLSPSNYRLDQRRK